MQQYRLLRNNKETGPYTRDALIKLGLKTWDLIWVDGKSAAWRYPSELAEFSTPVQEVNVVTSTPFVKPRYRITAESKKIDIKKPSAVINDETPAAIPTKTLLGWQDALSDWEKQKNVQAIEHNSSKDNPLTIKYSASLDDIKDRYEKTVLNRKPRQAVRIGLWRYFLLASLILMVAFTAYFLGKNPPDRDVTDSPLRVSSKELTHLENPYNEPKYATEQDMDYNTTQIENMVKPVAVNSSLLQNIPVVKEKKPTYNNEVLTPDNTSQEVHKTSQEIKTVTVPARHSNEGLLESENAVKNLTSQYVAIQKEDEKHFLLKNKTGMLLDLVVVDIRYYDSENKYKKGETIYVKNMAAGQQKSMEANGVLDGLHFKADISLISSDAGELYIVE
jgi:hypothetical protein